MQVEGHADARPDQRVEDPRPRAATSWLVTPRISMALMGVSQGLLAQPQDLREQQRGGDRRAEAPPGQADPGTAPSARGCRTARRRPGRRPS